MSELERTLADEALANLVDQFARPLDFLRELVQNALDAGTPRVEVTAAWEEAAPGHGLLALAVRDFGAGMDARTVDEQLTRLFASDKEGDLTKIGKFGIGFASVFALRPEVVRVRTGRLGEAWEVLFHADRTWARAPLGHAFAGTEVAVITRIAAAERARRVREARWVLGYWCEHTDRPVTFTDHTEAAAPAAASEDPFAAFAAPRTAPQTVSRPFELEAELVAAAERDGISARVGIAAAPRYGFYHSGLTLLSTQDPGCLGRHAPALAHLALKVRSSRLEHTLTRDNVLQDEAWERAMAVALDARDRLREALWDRIEAAVRDGEALGRWHEALAAEVAVAGRDALPADRPLFRDHLGGARTLAQIEAQEDAVAVVLVDDGQPAVRAAAAARGWFLLEDGPGLAAILLGVPRRGLLGVLPRGRAVRPASSRFVAPARLEPGAVPVDEEALRARVAALLGAIGVQRVDLGAFGGPEAGATEPLAIADPDGDLALRHAAAPRPRAVVLNRHHPAWQAERLLSREDLDVAAFSVAQAAGAALGIGPARHERLLAAAWPGEAR
jgi:hypothetical protein